MQVYETNFFGLKDQKLAQNDESKLLEEGIAVNSTASLDHTNPKNLTVLGNPKKALCSCGLIMREWTIGRLGRMLRL